MTIPGQPAVSVLTGPRLRVVKTMPEAIARAAESESLSP